MSKLFQLQILSPSRVLFRGDVESLTVETTTGRRGFLAGSVQMVCQLTDGSIQILHNKKWAEAIGSGGFLHVHADGITILCDHCRWPHEPQAEQPALVHAHDYKSTKAALAEKLLHDSH